MPDKITVMIKTPFDVVVAGELNVDLILNKLNMLPTLGKEILARDMTFTLGSSAAIFACNLSTLGAAVTFSGKIGNDPFGHKILAELAAKNVDTSGILFSDTAATGISIAFNHEQDRAMITYPGAMEEFCATDIPDTVLNSAAHLHVSSVFLQPALKPGLRQLFLRAKKLGLTTSLDPQWDPCEQWDLDLPALLPYVDIFLPNMAELRSFTGETTIQSSIHAISSYANIIAVKHGEAGAYIWDGLSLFHQPSFPQTDIADCIGAGDSFNAGFISQFIRQRSLRQCAVYAALAGAVNTTAAGGTTAFHSFDSFRTIASQKFNYLPE
jgi:sugar/nucleoside kinase (ribokinase family)